MRILALAAVGLALVGCESSPPNEPDAAIFADSVEAVGHVRVNPDSDADPHLVVTVTLRNVSSAELRATVLAECPVAVRLYPIGAFEAAPVYDGSARPCTRAGRLVVLSPGEVEILEGTLAISELREANISTGSYRVGAIVTAGAHAFEVDAGEVLLP